MAPGELLWPAGRSAGHGRGAADIGGELSGVEVTEGPRQPSLWAGHYGLTSAGQTATTLSSGGSAGGGWPFCGGGRTSGHEHRALGTWARAGPLSGLSGPGLYALIKQADAGGQGSSGPSLALNHVIHDRSPVGSGQFPGLDVGIWMGV